MPTIHTLSQPSASITLDAEEAGLTRAMTDYGGHLVAFERMDGVPFLAVNMAWTAASFHRSTDIWNGYVQDPGSPVFWRALSAIMPRFEGESASCVILLYA